MKTKYSSYFLILALFQSSIDIISSQPDDPKHLKTVEGPSQDKYKSPQLYVFGGKDVEMKDSASASQYNSSTGEWESTTRMSIARESSCGVAVGTKIYLFGGWCDRKELLDIAEVFDCQTGTYSQYRYMPGVRSACGAAVLDGHIYVVGGWTGSARLSSVFRYDIQTTRRQNVSSMHVERSDHQVVELGGLIYAIGGWNVPTVEAYNPTTDRWRMVANTKNIHFFSGATVHEGKIYVISENGFEVYSPENDEWSNLTSPPNNYRGRSLVSMDGKLWALGGKVPTIGNGTKSVFTYNISTKNWSQHADMDVARALHTAFVVKH